MVRLLQREPTQEERARIGFNPTMVRLLHFVRNLEHVTALGFNPTMVRLLPKMERAPYLLTVSIPQWCDCCFSDAYVAPNVTMFQSHNGAIAAAGLRRVPSLGRCFNPTMVRLLLVVLSGHELSACSFNPTMVRLLPKGRSNFR